MRILEYIVLGVEDISQGRYNKVRGFLNGLDIVRVPADLDFERGIFSIQADCLNSSRVEKTRTFFNTLK